MEKFQLNLASAPRERHKRERRSGKTRSARMMATVSGYIFLSVAILGPRSSLTLEATTRETSSSGREFVLFESQHLESDAKHDKMITNPREAADEASRFLRSKRRRSSSVVSSASADASMLQTNRLFEEQSKLSSQQTIVNVIPAASPNFEAAFQGECNQNNKSNVSSGEPMATSSNPCEHICLDLHDGTYECSCFYGFTLAVDGYSCAKLAFAAPQLPEPPETSSAAAGTIEAPPSRPQLVAAGKDETANEGKDEPPRAVEEQRLRHLGGGEWDADRKLGAAASGEILPGVRLSSSVGWRASAAAQQQKRRQAGEEPTSGAALKLAAGRLEQKLAAASFEPGDAAWRAGTFAQQQQQQQHSQTADLKRARQTGRRLDASNSARQSAASKATEAARWPKYSFSYAADADDDDKQLNGTLGTGSPKAHEKRDEQKEEAQEAQEETLGQDDVDPDVRSIMLANDRLASRLERAIGLHERQSGARIALIERLDYDLSLLDELVAKTIVAASSSGRGGLGGDDRASLRRGPMSDYALNEAPPNRSLRPALSSGAPARTQTDGSSGGEKQNNERLPGDEPQAAPPESYSANKDDEQ